MSRTKSATRDDVLSSYLLTPPRNDDELYHFLQAATGYQIPRRAVCPGHRAPFEMIADLYFQRATHTVGFANRSGGKTICMACLDLAEQTLKTGIETLHFGAIQAQADAGYTYFQKFIYSSPVFRDLLDGDSLMTETRFRNGNVLRIAPLTMQQASSPHVPIITVDELDKVERWDDFQQALSIPVTRRGVRASVRITSTRDIPNGPMNRLLSEAESRQFTVFEWCAWDVLQVCPVESDCNACSAYQHCKGRAKSLPPGGWMEIQDFINACNGLDYEKLRTQWFNELPHSDLLVYGPSWNDERNLVEPHDVPIDANRYRVFDFGQNNPTVCLWAYKDSERLVFYDEFSARSLASTFLADEIRKRESSSPHHQFRNPYGKMVPAKTYTNFGDPSGTSYLADLSAKGIATHKANNDLMGGISSVRAGLEKGTIQFMKGRCPTAVDHLKKYQWQASPDGKPVPETPLKVDDHFPDAVRYLVHSLRRGFRQATIIVIGA